MGLRSSCLKFDQITKNVNIFCCLLKCFFGETYFWIIVHFGAFKTKFEKMLMYERLWISETAWILRRISTRFSSSFLPI